MTWSPPVPRPKRLPAGATPKAYFLTPELVRRVRVAASEAGVCQSEVVAAAVEEYLDARTLPLRRRKPVILDTSAVL